MMKRLFNIVCFIILGSSLSFADIIHVPADQPTVQAGIDVSINGDTVLVQPGTWVENINFKGKNIVLGSLFLTTSDTSYISQTVIDGDSSGSVVTFENGEDSTAVLTGFTIQNGFPRTRSHGGGGITCLESDPKLTFLRISNNYADGFENTGGIYCGLSNPVLKNVSISNNQAYMGSGGLDCHTCSPILSNVIITGNSSILGSGGFGCIFASPALNNVTISNNKGGVGGILIDVNSNPVLTNVMISRNTGHDAGGIAGYDSRPTLSNVTIKENSGAGILFLGNFTPIFNTYNRCNIYFNTLDLESFEDDSLIHSIVVDTFTVTNPTEAHAFPLNKFTFDIHNALITSVDEIHKQLPTDYVLKQNYPNPFNPTTTIEYALPKTGHVQIEIYDVLGRHIKSLVNTTKGAGQYQTVWDGTDENHMLVAAGVYFYKMVAGDFQDMNKLLMIK